MKTLLLILIMFSGTVEAGTFSLEIGAGFNTNIGGAAIPWDDGGGLGGYGRLAYEHDLGNSTVIYHWIHLSQWNVGAPFNDKQESSVDHLGIALRWEW